MKEIAFNGKVVVVTGAASGMGLLAAQEFAARGAAVVMCDRDEAKLRHEVERLRSGEVERGMGLGQVVACPGDVRNFDDALAAAAKADGLGGCDILVTCAGGNEARCCASRVPFYEQPREVLDWGLDVNLKGPVYFARACMPAMVRKGAGVICCLGSVTAFEGDGVGAMYGTAKSGLVTLPEWDGKTLEVSAGSQGGWQAITAASRFHRVTRLVTNGTWGCDWTGQDTLGRLKSTYRPKTDAPALAYYDLVFAARRVTCPMAIEFAGMGDYVSPPSSLTALYNALPVPKKITYVQGSTHGWRPKGEQSFTVDGGYDRAVKGLCAVSDSTAGGHPSVCVDADSIRAEFDGRGRPLRLMSAKGVDFLEMRRAVQPEIWRIELCRAGDPAVTTNVHEGQAKSVRVQPTRMLKRY